MERQWLARPIREEADAEDTAAALSETDNPPLTDTDCARMRTAREVMPPSYFGPVTLPQSRFFTAEIDLDVAEHFKDEAGEDWEARMNEVLREVLARRKEAAE